MRLEKNIYHATKIKVHCSEIKGHHPEKYRNAWLVDTSHGLKTYYPLPLDIFASNIEIW